MKRLLSIYFAAAFCAGAATVVQNPIIPLSGRPKTNTMHRSDWVPIVQNYGKTNELINGIDGTNLFVAIQSNLTPGTATAAGLISTNAFTDFTVRNAHHSDQMLPPLGYTSWADNGTAVSEAIMSNQIQVIKANGTTAKYKFRWLNLDDGWSATTRDAGGNLVADPVKFPSGITGMNNIAHTNGFRIMWYMVAGNLTAGLHPGSKGYMFQDVTNLYARGADAVRVCNDDSGYDYADFAVNSPNLYLAEQIFPAINMMSRPFMLSLRVGQYRSWMRDSINLLEWQAGPGTTTSGLSLFDINNSQTNSIDVLDFYQPRTYLAGPGRFLDAGTLTQTGHQTTWAHFTIGADQRVMSIWALLHLPFWHPNFDMAAPYKYVWTNDYMLDIHQDPLVAPCTVVSTNGTLEVLATPMVNGQMALGMYNRAFDPITNTATVYWTNENLKLPAGPYQQFDVWNYNSFVNVTNSFSVSLSNDQFALYILTPTKVNAFSGDYYPSNTVSAASVLAGMTNGGSWVGMLSNSLQGVWMSNDVATWKVLLP